MIVLPTWTHSPTYQLMEGEFLIYSDDMTKQEPRPELPAEVWSREVFNDDRAWRATIAASKGNG